MEEDPVEGEEPVIQDPRLLKPDLYEAAKVNDTESVLKFLSEQVPPTFIDHNNGWTALHWAAKNGNMILLKKLLECGASAPYHRMQKQMEYKENQLNANNNSNDNGNNNSTNGIASSSTAIENRKHNIDEMNRLDYNGDIVPDNATNHVENGRRKVGKKGSKISLNNDDNDNDKDDENERDKDIEDDDDDEEEDIEFYLETSIDLLKNTPLQWATVKGHLRTVWLLLLDGYSPNDKDHLGNNSLHLAAVNGHLQILKVLVEDGGHANIVNIYKNLPIDMATDKEIREVLANAMDRGASMTAHDIKLKHEQNMITYTMHITNLNTAVSEALLKESQLAFKTVADIPDTIRSLSDAINDATEWALEESIINTAQKLLSKLEMTQDLLNDTNNLARCLPVKSQSTYVQNAHKLERTICRAEKIDVSDSQIQISRDLIQRCQMECLLSTLIDRLKDVTCAADSNEHDMNKLKITVAKAASYRASPDIVDGANQLYKRLHTELAMTRAMASIPPVRVPIENPPEGYWEECDIGRIEQTPEFPYPPPDSGGEYIWLHSETHTLLKLSIEKLKKCSIGADLIGANPSVIAFTKEKLLKAEKHLKILDVKDLADKTAALEAVAKLLKKTKKGGKKSKKLT